MFSFHECRVTFTTVPSCCFSSLFFIFSLDLTSVVLSWGRHYLWGCGRFAILYILLCILLWLLGFFFFFFSFCPFEKFSIFSSIDSEKKFAFLSASSLSYLFFTPYILQNCLAIPTLWFSLNFDSWVLTLTQ